MPVLLWDALPAPWGLVSHDSQTVPSGVLSTTAVHSLCQGFFPPSSLADWRTRGSSRHWLTRVTRAAPCTSREFLNVGPAGSWANPVPFRPFPRPRPRWGMVLECGGHCSRLSRLPAALACIPQRQGAGLAPETRIQGRVAHPWGSQARETRRFKRRERGNTRRVVHTAAGCRLLNPKLELEPN